MAVLTLNGGRIMRDSQRSVRIEAELALLLAVVLTTPGRVPGAEPLETIREAFRASSQGLSSGIGKGSYRQYRAITGGEWQLVQDADLTTYFDGKKYHIELIYHLDEYSRVDSRRIICDGESVTEARFTPRINPTGAEGRALKPEDFGGVSRPTQAQFPWDVSQLSRNVWNPDRLIRNVTPQRIEIEQTAEGDLVGSHPLVNTDRVRVRFECPRHTGFNLARMRVFNVGQAEPSQDVRVEWRQTRTGLWYIRSINETRVLSHPRPTVSRTRNVMKYTEFQANVEVDPKLFTEDALGLPSGSRVLDRRPGAKQRTRRLP
jgi:hypothetical protein